jgi:hypothetical protein
LLGRISYVLARGTSFYINTNLIASFFPVLAIFGGFIFLEYDFYIESQFLSSLQQNWCVRTRKVLRQTQLVTALSGCAKLSGAIVGKHLEGILMLSGCKIFSAFGTFFKKNTESFFT